MCNYIKFRSIAVISILVLFFTFIGGIFMGNISDAEEVSLDQHLAAIRSQNKGEGTDWGKLEQECLKLLKGYDSPEDKGEIYATIALIYAEKGYSSSEDVRIPKAIKYCKKALQCLLEVTTACEMYGRWAGSLMVKNWDCEEEEFVKRRREAIVPCLTGLKLTLDNKAPKKRQPPPAVGKYDISPSDPEYQTLMKKHKKEFTARKKWEFENKLYNCRKALTQRCVSLYSRKPYATDELKHLARKILKNHDAVKDLLTKVSANIGQIHKNNKNSSE